ncbi:MAG: hypothetical protein J3K34DRAFT_383443 [Monoraphidium minutum]|nr:MAG: hypothetical protein J3K34DRAFT_383443 [Monoraphidium minutum]
MDKEMEHAGSTVIASGRKGSVLAERYARSGGARNAGGGAYAAPPRFPTNEEVVKAVQQRVEETVDLCRNYRHAVWYMLFVAVYMIVLYFQASSFQAAGVVSTLRFVLLEDPSVNTLAFSSEDQVLAYLGNRVVRPVFTDPVCGDGRCEAPWEFPAWGRFGCRADCGAQPGAARVLVAVTGDFVGHASLSPRALMEGVRWNLCLDDAERRIRGETDLCWFERDQAFTQYQETQLQSVALLPGSWYVRVLGDYAGRVSGAVYNAANESDPQPIPVQPEFESCKAKRQAAAAAAAAAALSSGSSGGGAGAGMRRLQEALERLKAARGEEGARELMERALLEGAAARRASAEGASGLGDGGGGGR